jgi:putative nucleotidyltransferase with HDIG domain
VAPPATGGIPPATLAMLDALSRAMSARDSAIHDHSQRVQRYAVALAIAGGIADDFMIDAIEMAALLHDIGKLAIPDRLLDKPGPLTDDEFEEVKQHVVIGADILSAVAFPGPLASIVRHHHEKWDGTGYPDRLGGGEIPIGARVLALADTYDALTSDRPYRRRLPHDRAVAIIQDGCGTVFDPELAEVFLRLTQRLDAAVRRKVAGGAGPTAGEAWLREVAV